MLAALRPAGRSGAEFGSYGGWERADWFRRMTMTAWPLIASRQHWFDTVGEECRHVAAHAGILD